MPQFTVRVELHHAEWTDYERLHAAMEQQGFSRLIRADTGHTYHMPWAEYNGTANLTSMQVLEIARTAKRHPRDRSGKSSLDRPHSSGFNVIVLFD